MKFNCGLTAEERLEKDVDEFLKDLELDEQWHDYFALIPTRVGHKDCRWLETIQRKKKFIGARDRESISYYIWTGRAFTRYFWEVEYRAKEKDDTKNLDLYGG